MVRSGLNEPKAVPRAESLEEFRALQAVDPCRSMQILHPFPGSVHDYLEQLGDPDLDRPRGCPQCNANQPLTAHGFYRRTLTDSSFDGTIPIRRYLCDRCRRTVSLLPWFALPYLRFSLASISAFLVACLLTGKTLIAAMPVAGPYQRGQSWIRRFQSRAASLCVELGGRIARPQTLDFVQCALEMLESLGWMPAHCYLFGEIRQHLLGWPKSLAPSGRRVTPAPPRPPPEGPNTAFA